MATVTPPGAGLPRRIWWPRTLGLALGGLCVAGALWPRGAPAVLWVALALHALAWPHLAYLWSRSSADPSRAERRNLLLDAAFGGFWLPAMAFDLLPSVLLATMLTMNLLAVGGRTLLARGLAAHALGIGAALTLLPWRFEPQTAWVTLLLCLPFLVGYPLTIGLVTFRLSARLSAKRRALQQSEALLRDTLDAMDAGVVLFDAQDRLLLCNRGFRELYEPIAPLLQPGMSFGTLLREAMAAGLVPQASAEGPGWLDERLVAHARPQGPILRELADGRWRRIIETRLPDGSLLAFSTDVTDLVQREQQLNRALAERAQYESQLRHANVRLERLSTTDGLTGMANRRYFDHRLQQEWQRARREHQPLALLMIDVDHFKRYNDRHGHVAGDACLSQVARALRASARRGGDLAARYGGEEFVLLLPSTSAAEAQAIGEHCLAAVDAAAIEHGDSPLAPHVTVSIGVAVAQPTPASGLAAVSLVHAADQALYRAKHAGRHCVATAPPAEAA